MGEVQLWQAEEGLGTDKETLERVLHVFRSDGVQGVKSQQSFESYIKGLDNDNLRTMYEIDSEATIQIMVDCFGASTAFYKFTKIIDYEILSEKEMERAGWISPAAYAEVVGKYEERTKKLEDEKDKLLSRCEDAIQKADAAEKQSAKLQNTLAYYKADLYDFYAQAGKVPSYR